MRNSLLHNLLRKCAWLLLGLPALVSCETITEELHPCANYVEFCYDRNMKFVDAFPTNVKRVDLYVFDAQGKYVGVISDERQEFGHGYRMEFPFAPGTYRLIAWAGLYDRSYECRKDLECGVSTPEDICVKMCREGDAIQRSELDCLWHGETTVTFSDGQSHTETISLTKNTNKFRIVVQGPSGEALSKDNLTFTITDDNGHLNHDNTLLPDDMITYRTYYKDDADLSETKSAGVSAVVAEMNTLRLMADKHPRMRITGGDGRELIDIDLIKYLLLTKMEGHDMDAQEYLDRQDEYAMIFFMDKDAFGNYLLLSIKVNGWTLRPQEGDFGL